MTKAKLAFVRCRLGCLSRCPVRFFPSFPFCLSVVVRLSSFSLSGIGTCRLFPAADFSPSSYCLFLPAVRFAFFPVFSLLPVRCCSPVVVFAVRHWDLPAFPRGGFFAIVLLSFPSRRPVCFFPRLFPFACLLLFACRRFRCPALGLAGFFPRRIFRYRLSVFFIVFSFPPSGLLFSRLFPFAGISLPCLSFPSSLFVSGLSFLLFSSLFSPFCFFFFTGKRQAVVRPADMAAVWR